MLQYKLNNKQEMILEGMAYRIADINYLKERYKPEEVKHELETSRRTLEGLIKEADKESIPYWVQNIILVKYENWRLWFETTVRDFLKKQEHYSITF